MRPECDHGRVEAFELPDHEFGSAPFGGHDHFVGFIKRQCDRLLDEDVHAPFEKRTCDLTMRLCRGRDRDDIDLVEQFTPIRK